MQLQEFLSQWNDSQPTLTVRTSGSTGTPKAITVEKYRMLNSARITCDFLGLKSGDTALLCLPLDYIAGKMMVVRSIERGLKLIDIEPDGHPMRTTDSRIDFAAMVPLQVYNSLQVREERERLMNIRHLIIGGGAISPELAAALKDFPHNVWSTYGMTETLSHIALRRISGKDADEYYTPFESVAISINAEGCLCINAPQVAEAMLTTNDIAELHPDGRRFRIIGRRDNIICSGGLKIQIEQLEAQLHPHLSVPFAITSRPDVRLGQAVTLVTEDEDLEQVMQTCRKVLHPHHVPRHIIHTDHIPMTETGKPARSQIKLLVNAD